MVPPVLELTVFNKSFFLTIDGSETAVVVVHFLQAYDSEKP